MDQDMLICQGRGRYLRRPLIFDDLDRTRFNNHAVALIKDDYVGLGEYPTTVLSMNADKDTFEPEVRKRCLIAYTGASLPDHTGEARRQAKHVNRIKRNLGNALYREYLNSTLAIWPCDTPHRLATLQRSLRLFAGRSGRPTRKKSPTRQQSCWQPRF